MNRLNTGKVRLDFEAMDIGMGHESFYGNSDLESD